MENIQKTLFDFHIITPNFHEYTLDFDTGTRAGAGVPLDFGKVQCDFVNIRLNFAEIEHDFASATVDTGKNLRDFVKV